MKKHRYFIGVALIIATVLLMVTGCSSTDKEADLLDPDKPITVTVWHYYNGYIKEKFDTAVAEFNETVGMEKGIVIDAKSQADAEQLDIEVLNAANGSMGASLMPDIFAAYPESAFQVKNVKELVSLDEYFSEEELSEYREEFLEEGKIASDGKVYIMPVAKSTENLYVNKTLWDEFAEKNGFQPSDLQTWEGLVEVAEAYYKETGEGFFGINENVNYMIQSSVQLGGEMFDYSEDGTAEFALSKEIAKKIWQNYYVPYIKGHFVKTGRFSSDDVRTGTSIAYTGSTGGASYFPEEVTLDQGDVVPIEPMILPYPYFEDGKKYAVQRGAGMCIVKSDRAHEYASAEFLRWFTDTERNVNFAISTGYFPVKNEALKEEVLIEALESAEIASPAVKASIITTKEMLKDYSFYNSKPFEKSYEAKTILESHLIDRVRRDLELIKEREAEGQLREQIIESLSSDESFETWYSSLREQINKTIKK
ncbi:hypothetical protein EUAN_04030 [Andreesenia angusta]|uniref:Sn-glycerol-3-phosphate-binding periplasmic protein UgpB n=1 Tax=Andreesenia angusta TaxID=39480 RepID=A0A1S1VCM4_9FIRM|nr:extracellular solute-binding protein [Andreesenia angusta]OHW63539.1 hypothetical protein EUAN_04030 [Andreesenia angusta]